MTQNISEVTEQNFDLFIKDGLVFIDFYADWCMPCLMMAPIIEEIGKKFKGKIKFGKINIDENIELAKRFEIRSIPSFIIFEDGKIKERFIGTMYIKELEDKLKKYIKQN
ncbi:MAG: thioredoxin [Candidatus Pacearchaeota archaeon]